MELLTIRKTPYIISLTLGIALTACRTPKPHVAPVAGLYTCPVMVTISDSRPNAVIYYTTDGSAPTTASTKYSRAFSISSTDTLLTTAIAPGAKPSVAAHIEYSCALTRGQFATYLQKQFNLPPPSKPVSFPDVTPDRPDYSAVQASAAFMNEQMLCATCYIRALFYPDESIYREIWTLAVLRVLIANGKVQLLSASDSARVLAQVSDAANLPIVSRPYFATAIRTGILPLGEGNRIEPSRLQTRNDVADIFGLVQKRFNLPPTGVVTALQ